MPGSRSGTSTTTLCRRHGYTLGYTTTRLWLQQSGAVAVAPKRGAHRRKRPRRPMAGMMLHQDGSTHAWLAEQPPLDLVITLDDATSTIYSAFLVDQEGTASTLRGLAEVIERRGLFIELYTDRGSHYFHTPEAGGKVSKTRLTQVGRALRQLGIGHIAAYSPQARGRCERAFRTLQDRLPKELQLAGVTTVAAANRYLHEVYLAEHNASFAVTPEQPASAFVPVPAELWRDVLSVQEERQVGNDNCVRWQGRVLQIPPSPLRPALRSQHGAAARLSGRHGRRSSRARTVWPPSRRRPSRRPRSRPRDYRDAARPVDLWTALRPAHNPTGPATAANSCAPYGGQVNALATRRTGATSR